MVESAIILILFCGFYDQGYGWEVTFRPFVGGGDSESLARVTPPFLRVHIGWCFLKLVVLSAVEWLVTLGQEDRLRSLRWFEVQRHSCQGLKSSGDERG